jgi:gamma-glutamylcyclotransferase (GGCT)/AIG2-like uncharacterized protein YtfP
VTTGEARPVFVYGTLRPGFSNWPVAEPFVTRRRPGRLADHRLYLLEYPVAIPSVGARIVGDLLWLAGGALARLDRFEDHRPEDQDGSVYRRVIGTVDCDGESVDAWVYVGGTAYTARAQPDHEVTSGEYAEV